MSNTTTSEGAYGSVNPTNGVKREGESPPETSGTPSPTLRFVAVVLACALYAGAVLALALQRLGPLWP